MARGRPRAEVQVSGGRVARWVDLEDHQGMDYEISDESMRTAMHTAARARELTARTALRKGTLTFQAVADEPAPMAPGD